MQIELQVAAYLQIKPTNLAVSLPIIGSYHPHPPSPYIIITQPILPSHGELKAELT